MDYHHSNALVVGAGISGIRAALDLAQRGMTVELIDRHPAMGGLLTQLDFQFPSNHCGMCRLLPLTRRDDASQFCLRKGMFHENIRIRLSCELKGLEGEAGNYTVRLRQKPTWVDPERCVGCGLCEAVCPSEIPDCFNEGLSGRKAIHLPVPHAIPNAYVIDLAACTRCGECEKVCPADAIQLSQSSRKDFHILVVDDELSIRDSLKEWLEEEDFSVDMAASGPEALEMLEKKPYALMLTDIKMPEMDGTELLDLAKKAHPDLCVVMMTAYATVETAVQAMKTGAMDYLLKPFDPQTLIPMVIRIFQDVEASKDLELQVDTVVISSGTTFYDPADERNLFGYGIHANVLTHIEFERLLSHTGPTGGRLARLDNQQPVKKIAWLQCVGSRDIQTRADFCSSICCMIALKEAVLARELSRNGIDTAIFYMDMRTFGKSFQQYYDKATESGVRFVRCKIHSLSQEADTQDLVLRYMAPSGGQMTETFDMVVLSTGQRPAGGMPELSKILGVDLNPFGFIRTGPFDSTATGNPGVFAGGSATGLKDIAESVIHASAAGLNAARVIASKGEPPAAAGSGTPLRDVSREPVRICTVVCSCSRQLHQSVNPEDLLAELSRDPDMDRTVVVDRLCTAQGWETMMEKIRDAGANRFLVAACHPYVFTRRIRELARKMNLDSSLFHAVDTAALFWRAGRGQEPDTAAGSRILQEIQQGAVILKQVCPEPLVPVDAARRALVIGGGIGGMTAALSIADQDIEVDLVEKTGTLGGNCLWLTHTLEGDEVRPLLDDTVARVRQHPKISLFTGSTVLDITGSAPSFSTMIENENKQPVGRSHGAVILATGGDEAATTAFGYGDSPQILTQKELARKWTGNEIDAGRLNTVVMILCVDSRTAPKNYCSRVCCPTALKQARELKTANPELDIYIIYRDMMTCGFSETYFTQARNDNIIFIAYDPADRPGVETDQGQVRVTVNEPTLGVPLEIEADLLVLATGVTPGFPESLAGIPGIDRDDNGFFREADTKWRPVDSMTDGIFACGLVHSPRSVADTVATARAAAGRALTILSQPVLVSGRVTAKVRHSLCSLCERCIPACPYGARILDTTEGCIRVNGLMCQGCGACAAVCPNDATILEGYSGQRMLGAIDAAFQTMPN